MKQFFIDQIYYFASGWMIFCFLGLWVRLQTKKIIYIRDCIWALLFGPFYFAVNVGDLDAVVLDIRKKEK